MFGSQMAQSRLKWTRRASKVDQSARRLEVLVGVRRGVVGRNAARGHDVVAFRLRIDRLARQADGPTRGVDHEGLASGDDPSALRGDGYGRSLVGHNGNVEVLQLKQFGESQIWPGVTSGIEPEERPRLIIIREGTCEVGDGETRVEAGQAICVLPGEVLRMRPVGEGPLTTFEIDFWPTFPFPPEWSTEHP